MRTRSFLRGTPEPSLETPPPPTPGTPNWVKAWATGGLSLLTRSEGVPPPPPRPGPETDPAGATPEFYDIRQGPEEWLALRCGCGEHHFLVLERWEWKDEPPTYSLSISETWRRPRGLWNRLKATLHFYRKAEYHSADVELNREAVEAMEAWCLRELNRMDGVKVV